MFKFLAIAQAAFAMLQVADLGVRQVQATIPDAEGDTKLGVVLGTIESAIKSAEQVEVNFEAVKPALTGAINALVAGYKAEKNPAFVPATPATDGAPGAPAPVPAAKTETVATDPAVAVPAETKVA